MIESLLCAMALSLLLTLGLELAAYGMFGVRGGRNYLLCLLVNLLTNPAVVLLHRLASLRFPGCLWAATLLLEALAVAVEGLCLKAFGQGLRRPFLLSLAANLFSYGVGRWISWLL